MTEQAILLTPKLSSTPTQIKVPLLTLVLDPGTSCTKSIYCKGRRGKPKYLINSSLACPISIQPEVGTAYVKLPEDEQYYLVGHSAAQAKVQTSIKQLKSESLIPKVLGAIGQIAQDESLPPQFQLKIRLLLPVSEMADCDFIETELNQVLTNFNYSGRDYQVDLASIEFKSEGSGINSYLSRSISPDEIKNQTCAYLMFGYRNTSMLLMENGQFNRVNSHSTDLGFYSYLDYLAQYSSGLYRDDIQRAIVSEPSYGVDGNCKQVVKGFSSHIRVEDLIRSSNPKHQERERTLIQAAITRADQEYWGLLNRWLTEKLPPLGQLDRVIYCGGSISFIETPIKDFFKGWQGKLLNTNQMSIQMLNKLNLTPASRTKFIEQYLPVRMADAWGEFVDLTNMKL